MSIQVGNSNAGLPIRHTEGGPETARSADAAPRLMPADLSRIEDPRLRNLLGSGAPLLPGVRGDGAVPEGLGAKLDGVAAHTDIYAVMALFQKLGQDSRNSARAERQAELQNRMDALADAAMKMRVAAVVQLAAGLVSSVVQIGGGLMRIAGGATALKNEGQAMAIQNLTEGLAKAVEGVGGMGKSGLDFGAQQLEAGKADAERLATLASSKYDQANETMQQMRDLIRDVQAKLSEIEQSGSDTRKQIVRA